MGLCYQLVKISGLRLDVVEKFVLRQTAVRVGIDRRELLLKDLDSLLLGEFLVMGHGFSTDDTCI